MDQNILAEALGVTPSHISQVLSGKTPPPLPDRSPFIANLESVLQFERGELARLATEERYQRDLSKTREKYERNLRSAALDEGAYDALEERPFLRATERKERLEQEREVPPVVDACEAPSYADVGELREQPALLRSESALAPEFTGIPLLSRKQVARKVFSRRRAIRREVTSFLTGWADRAVEGLYALTVWDNSMAPKFERGDRVIVDPKAPLKRPDVVVCCTRNKDIFIRRMIARGELIALEPLNPSFDAITLKSTDVKFSHKVVEVIFKE